jgi:hypothetical protein
MTSIRVASAQAVGEPIDFQAVLSEAGIADADFAVFEGWNGSLTKEQADLAAKLLYRLQWLGNSRNALFHEKEPPSDATAIDSRKAGTLATINGVAVSHSRVTAETSTALDRSELWLTVINSSSGDRIAILASDIPVKWMELPGDQLDEPVELVAIVLGSAELSGEKFPLVLANRLTWRPTSNVPAGTAWLVRQGFDASLFDDVRHGQPFAKGGESRESEAFYACLSIMARSDAGPALAGLVRNHLESRASDAEAEAENANRRLDALSSQWQEAGRAERKKLEGQLQAARRQQAIAAGIASQAERGLSSVVPLFLSPEQYTGEAVLLEGTARRAIRIVINDDPADSDAASSGDQGAAAWSPVDEYYELDVFTKDSQHLPIICCVPSLPAGFPTGEVIREPVRVSGIFFKKWAYARRTTDDPATRRRRLPERLEPPLIIAAMPEWMASTPPTVEHLRGLLGGLGLVATILIIWIYVAAASRRVRMARSDRARYDSPLEKIAEP